MPTLLEMALLSMDAYEKGLDGLNRNAGLGEFALGAPASAGSQASGFFAQEYIFSGGKVLAYAGTNSGMDLLSGWDGGILGDSTSVQYLEAAKFYQNRNGGSISTNPNVYVTGHSLGGGLAGFVGALYGVSATVFDNINFKGAAQGVYDRSKDVPLFQGALGPRNPHFRDEFYLGDVPPLKPSTYSVSGRYLSGEAAEVPRFGNWSPPVEFTPFTQLNPADLHQMNLMVLTMFGNLQGDKSWYSIANEYGRALFNDLVSGGISGVTDPEQMRTKIAYSVVEDGALVFGNVAVRALYNDLNDIANIHEQGSLNPLIAGQGSKEALAEIAVQYAGDLAEQKSEVAGEKKGAIEFDSAKGLFSIDFDYNRWVKSSTGEASTIDGRDYFVDVVFELAGIDESLWQGTAAEVTQIKGATGSTAALLAGDAPAQKNDEAGAVILIGGEGNDELQGGDGRDVLFGGDGDDLLRGGDGQDLLVGGDGNDTILLEIDRNAAAGENTDTYVAGGGNDNFILTGLRDFESPTVEFRIENAEAGDRLYAAYNLFNGTNGAWEGSPLLPLLGGIINMTDGTINDLRNGTTNAYFEWMRESDLHRGEDWGGVGTWYFDQTDGIIKFVGWIEYTFDGDDLLVHLFAGGEEEFQENDPENYHYLTTNLNVFYQDTETIIRIVDFDDGDLGLQFVGLPDYNEDGLITGWDDAVSAITDGGQFGEGVTFQSPSTVVGVESGPEDEPAAVAPARGDAGAGQTINGTSNSETLTGTSADDTFTLTGDGGTDTYEGGDGFDRIEGSTVDDQLRVQSGLGNIGSIEEINGGDGTDEIIGTSSDDVFDFSGITLDSIEFINLGDGNDSVIGTAGDDIFKGGAGSDHHVGGFGFDTVVYGGSSSLNFDLATPTNSTGSATGDSFDSIEWFVLSSAADTFVGSDGADGVDGGLGNDTLSGGAGDDVLEGGGGADVLNGGDGSDAASYATSAALVLDRVTTANSTGDAAGDTFNSIEQFVLTAGDDSFVGSGQWETIDGGAGDDILSGGSGNDTIIGGAGGDQITGGSGTDTASYRDSLALTVDLATPGNSTGDAVGDTFSSIEWFELTGGNDAFVGSSSINRVMGGAGDDSLTGGVADDTLIGGADADSLDGSGGYDTAAYDGATSGVTIDIQNPSNGLGDAKGDTFVNIEKFRMTDYNDTFLGGSSGESIHGAGGDDILSGGSGNDDLYGDAGNDTFVFGTGFGKDKIYDFNSLSGDHDLITFQGGAFSSYAEVQTAMAQVGTDVVITIDSATTLTVKNVSLSGLTSDCFVF